MNTENGTGAQPAKRKERTREQLRYRRETVVPTLAVTAVAIAAVVTAVMVKRNDLGGTEMAAAPPPTQTQADAASKPPAAQVVQAPPLKASPDAAAPGRAAKPATRAPATAMGGSAACANCGVVEMVVAVHEYAKPIPSGYQMHIRMDDGTVRTVEQRGALAAGSRVVVEGQSVRALAFPSQG
jgi:hypothetical protein